MPADFHFLSNFCILFEKEVLQMRTPASVGKHPIHPMVVAFPIGLWVFSLILDVLYIIGWGGDILNDVSYYAILGGIIGAVFAAVPGFVDYLSLQGHSKTIATWHLIANVSALGMFAISFALRAVDRPVLTAPLILSLIGVALIGVGGWLGGELVYVHGVAVESPEEHEH
ncbi:MAG: DUF2231 domain-containing protein [Candidatus Abyssobacteria bacterium SURF_5]|uniref:DUF2231 domain-containing protein n=1 Tax=Abyssobacteria bacterium (strain SURF_5) TaxID=2093360 RepID=A0A3A4NHJ1_ABYX5|nr:MAG: DUF2231 domain-containing protein [Candidatus Abyssubacteria bacterium SURF_5]